MVVLLVTVEVAVAALELLLAAVGRRRRPRPRCRHPSAADAIRDDHRYARRCRRLRGGRRVKPARGGEAKRGGEGRGGSGAWGRRRAVAAAACAPALRCHCAVILLLLLRGLVAFHGKRSTSRRGGESPQREMCVLRVCAHATGARPGFRGRRPNAPSPRSTAIGAALPIKARDCSVLLTLWLESWG